MFKGHRELFMRMMIAAHYCLRRVALLLEIFLYSWGQEDGGARGVNAVFIARREQPTGPSKRPRAVEQRSNLLSDELEKGSYDIRHRKG